MRSPTSGDTNQHARQPPAFPFVHQILSSTVVGGASNLIAASQHTVFYAFIPAVPIRYAAGPCLFV